MRRDAAYVLSCASAHGAVFFDDLVCTQPFAGKWRPHGTPLSKTPHSETNGINLDRQSKMKWLASLCVLANFVLSACIAEPPLVHLDKEPA